MNSNDDTNFRNNCPYCDNTETCSHNFATYNASFGQIEDGNAIEINEIDKILCEYFYSNINSHRQSHDICDTYDEFFQELWLEVLSSNEGIEIRNETELCLPYYGRFLFEILSTIEEPREYESEGGPGQSSVLFDFYTEDSKNLNDLLQKEIKNYLGY